MTTHFWVYKTFLSIHILYCYTQTNFMKNYIIFIFYMFTVFLKRRGKLDQKLPKLKPRNMQWINTNIVTKEIF